MANGRPWTTEETNRLRELAASMPGPEVAAALGRSTQAVRQRAHLWAIPLAGHRWGLRQRSGENLPASFPLTGAGDL